MAKSSVTSYTGENVFSLTEDKMMKLTDGNRLQTPSDPPKAPAVPLEEVDLVTARATQLDKLFASLD